MIYRVGLLTISDRGAKGLRTDTSGPLLAQRIVRLPGQIDRQGIVPDDIEAIRKWLLHAADHDSLDLVLTTGGTGLAPSDVTPEATLSVIERIVPGLSEILRMEGYRKSPYAILSRAVAGVRGRTLMINLPGSPRAVLEGLEILMPILPHALDKMKGDLSDCGSS